MSADTLFDKVAVRNLSSTVLAQLLVFMEALQIFQERNAKRGDRWNKFPPARNLLWVEEKLERVLEAEERGEFAEDDALDIINYITFYIRKKREMANEA